MLKRLWMMTLWCAVGCAECLNRNELDLIASPDAQTVNGGEDAVVQVKVICSSDAAVTVVRGSQPTTVDCKANGSHAPIEVKIPASTLVPGTHEIVFTAASTALRGTRTATVKITVNATGPGVDVTVVGSGGSVVSAPLGITCPGTCALNTPAHTSVTLTAMADETHRFTGWSGDAACATGQVYVDEARVRCTATFVVRTGSDWLQAGGPLNVTPTDTVAEISGSAVIFDNTEKPIAAWVENKTVRIFRRDANTWSALGATPPSTSAVGSPSLSLDAAGAPLVAWTEDDGMGTVDVFVARFDAGAWTRLGTGPLDRDPGQLAREPSLAGPNVAWVETEPGGMTRIVVRRYANGAWTNPAAADLPAGTGLRAPKLVRSAQGLAVAWATATSVQASELMLGATAWNPMTPDPFTGLSGNFAFDFGSSYSDGYVLVAAPFVAGTFQPKRWKGFWENLGAPRGTATSIPTFLCVSHTVLPGDPVIAWHAGTQTQVEQFSAGAWVRLGSPVSTQNRQNAVGSSLGLRVAQGNVPVLLETVSGAVGTANDMTLRAWEFR